MDSTSATTAHHTDDTSMEVTADKPTVADKGKGKATHDESMEEDEEEEEEDDDDEDEEEEDDDEEEEDDDDDESGEKIDPSAILPRTRRAAAQRIDYSSEAALAKAGLTRADLEKEDDAMES
ncbi:hypothetical protein DL93DRAFT_2073746 [Clavulina sp. PMI_390]|nr:hypothetical protein DL93DRAFT_2073746 [Clavulina sp. PMI_390]